MCDSVSLSINTDHGETMKSPDAASSPPGKPMKCPEAASSPAVKPMKSPEAASSPAVKPMKSPEAASSPAVKPMKSPNAASSHPVKPMKSPEAVSSPPVKPMKSADVLSTVNPMESPEAVSSTVKPMETPKAVSSPPVKPMKPPEAASSPPIKPLLDEPRFTATTDTGYEYLYSVICLSDDEIWTCGDDDTMKLFNLQGKLLKLVHTESGNTPADITVTRGGDLIYTDPETSTVNLVKNKQIQIIITLQGWRPLYVCSTASDDLLVTMHSNDKLQSKIVRFSGSTETQTIQLDDHRQPLYSPGYSYKSISENRNLDICVADIEDRAIVVVNHSGKFRFRYTGNHSNTNKSFNPVSITTDSQSHILTVANGRIHILDQDGQFLRYIESRGLGRPWGLCVDIRDNLFVAEWNTAEVKRLQYL